MTQEFMSTRAAKPVGAYPHAKRVGNMLFLSGVGPRKSGTDEIPDGIEAQCRGCFDNVRAVIEDAGASWSDIVDVVVFLTDMKNDFPVFNRLWAEYFAGEGKPNPTRTTLEVTALPTAIDVELKVIATIAG
jgi:2-aminomuconate deaminase